MTNKYYFEPDDEFIPLQDIISFKDFSFSADKYRECEKQLLEPQLTKLGYHNFVWGHGEYDSFGPLTRVVSMHNHAGELIHGIYG